MNQRRFIFVKDFTCQLGTLRAGSELIFLDGRIYFNGGQIEPQYYNLFFDFLKGEIESPNYLKEKVVPFNKA